MLHGIWDRAFAYKGNPANLEELRTQLAGRLALLLIIAISIALLVCLYTEPFPLGPFALLIAILLLEALALASAQFQPGLARCLMVSSLTLGLMGALGLSEEPWLVFLALPLTFVDAMLASGSELLTAVLVAATAAGLTWQGYRTYPLAELSVALALSVASAWLATRTFNTALEWAWNTQQRADRLLEETREHRAELSRTVKSLDVAYTVLQRTQNELVFARRQADEARRMKEQFAANISHELRTPLNLILGFSEVMYSSPEVYGEVAWPPILRRDIYQIYRSSRHLMEMIDDILDLSRYEMVGFTLSLEPTPIGPLLHNTAEIAQDLFRGRPVTLEVEIDQNLPNLEIDRTRIRQVLLNLLNNAQRFTEAGIVRLEARQKKDEVIISVRDTGPGIPADQLQSIFDEFYQVDRSLRSGHKGIGLGLAISKRFVQAHDGRIWAESQEGHGATLYFTLPIPGQSVPASHLSTEGTRVSQAPPTRSSIMLVEADPAVGSWMRRHIPEYDIVQTPNADRLDDQIRLYQPRAIIRNVQPNGMEDRAELSATAVPLIECSLPSQSWLAKELMVAACLTKPVTSEQLLEALDRLGSFQRVLIIDDDRGFGQLIERILGAAGRGLQMEHAYDGAEGLAAMRARRPDIVMLDLIMPGVDGFQVLEEMRHDPALADLPVMLLTATNYAEDTLTKRGSQLVIHHREGLQPAQVLRYLRAALGAVEPHYEERSTAESAAEKPALAE